VIEGESYMFIAKAVNKWGQADEWSEATTILAATVPKVVTGVVSIIDTITGGVNVTWSTPLNRGTPITEYTR
jgi:ABC-type microcin C transport system permease subunit YejB